MGTSEKNFMILIKKRQRITSKKQFYRKMCFFLGVLMFCSSCHSYRSMDKLADEIKLNKKYKITTQEYQKKKVIIKEVKQAEIVMIVDKEEVKIPIKEIDEIKRRKFSYVKTLALSVTVFAGISAWALASISIAPDFGGLRFPN